MRPSRGWLVVALLLVAGCNGMASQPTASSTVSPVPVPTTDRTATPASYPPGVSVDGVYDARALAAAHETTLNGSYAVQATQAIRSTNGTLLARRAVAVRLGADHERFHTTLDIRGPLATNDFGTPPVRAEFWSDGERYLRSLGETEYGTYMPVVSYSDGYVVGTGEYWVTIVAPGGQPHQDIAPLFAAAEMRVIDRTRRNGRVQYRLESVGLARPAPLDRIETAGAIENLTLEATVDRRGLVRSYRLAYTGRLYGRTVRVNRTVRYADVGTTTVDRPSWYDEAVDNQTDRDQR